jgi:hypothetical protein
LATHSAQKAMSRGTAAVFPRCSGHGYARQQQAQRKGSALRRKRWRAAAAGNLSRHRPEPVSAKLRMIYGNIVAEQLPDTMLDLLSELDRKTPSKSSKQ